MSVSRQACEDTVEILKKYSFFKDLVVISQDSKSILFEMKNALGRQGLIVVISAKDISWQGYISYEGQYAGAYDVNLEITAIENPTVSRSNLKITGQDAILEAAYILSREYQRYSVGKYSQYEDGQLVANSLEAKCLAIEGAIVPEKPKSASDYVKEGLVAMWDGEENIGFGQHSKNPRTWTDLAGNGFDMILSGDVSFSDKSIDFAADQFNYAILPTTGATSNLYDALAGDYQLEVVVKDKHTGNVRYINGPANLPLIGYAYAYRAFGMAWNTANAPANRKALSMNLTGYETTQQFSMHFTRNAGNTATYARTPVFASGEFRELENNFSWGNVGQRFNIGNSAYKHPFSVYSVRLYSRPLTEDDIRHNYEIDKARFPLTDMSTIPTTLEDVSEDIPVTLETDVPTTGIEVNISENLQESTAND